MILLILAILSSSFIFVLFKLFPKFSINTFQAIVFNYITACICGFALFGNFWKSSSIETSNWPAFAVACGVLFISLFFVMGISSQKNGVAMTSVAVKMSMALSMLFMILFYGESVSLIKIGGIIAAFLGVFLMAYQKTEKTGEKSYTWMLILLFTGSAVLDLILNYVQKYELKSLPNSLFSAVGFGVAGFFGLLIIGVQFIRGVEKLHLKSGFAGVFLGIPNYFSIYLLLEAYTSTGWNDSTVLAIMNVSIVMVSALIGFIVFKENLNKQKVIGLITAVVAIVLLYFATNN
jgi:drug/metabolite transporter (DMT)-like permease